jgi:hypothetical protein
MDMGRKGAILMLAGVVLWAATPALASLIPAQCRSCCQVMAMECDSAVMNAAHPCCQLQSSSAAVPLGIIVAPKPQADMQHTMATTVLPALSGVAIQTPESDNAPPHRSLSGASTILRI